jgi:hypothetical protein
VTNHLIIEPFDLGAYMAEREADPALRLPDSETHLQHQIVIAARRRDLLVHHVNRGSVTMPGFPDLTIAGNSGHAFWELKSVTGALSPAQERWRRALKNGGAPYSVITPMDWQSGAVLRWLDRLADGELIAA